MALLKRHEAIAWGMALDNAQHAHNLPVFSLRGNTAVKKVMEQVLRKMGMAQETLTINGYRYEWNGGKKRGYKTHLKLFRKLMKERGYKWENYGENTICWKL